MVSRHGGHVLPLVKLFPVARQETSDEIRSPLGIGQAANCTGGTSEVE